MNELLLSFLAAAEAGPAVVGGKGWNLGRLHRYGFPVPQGGVLTAEAYIQFMAQPALAVIAPDSLHEAIQMAPVPAPVEEAVRSFLERSGLANRPVAVRSSATAEDGTAASFAGIHGSFLNVVGPDAVLSAVKGCYASLWTPQALAYRQHQGFADRDVNCAVVICEMVGGPDGKPRAAGVAFSCDPLTGRRDQVAINAAPGLGEGVVSGQVNPEAITVDTSNMEQHVAGRHGPADRVRSAGEAEEMARLTTPVRW
ncbi:MAG: PEP/pyruvate-binding domain-containing protein, partial [Mycobacterium leprae]